ncbi:MAG: toxin-activating lysine-acyltransferase [Hyphomicrobiales bacterium]|nr:toxin-activating lysine-acyltransferase [Hyphomicrobiales bacterium]
MEPRLNLSAVEPRLHRFADPTSAFGLAASYMMTMPAFSQLPFGYWSRALAGQIDRNHYVFVRNEDAVIGFAGWAFANTEEADAWLVGRHDPSLDGGGAGDALLVSTWIGSTPTAHHMLLRHMRWVGRNKRAVYFKRRYRDGRMRAAKLRPHTAHEKALAGVSA